MKKITLIFFTFLSLFISDSFAQNAGFEIYAYNKGVSDKITINELQKKKLLTIITDVYEKADKKLSLSITKADLSKIKKKDRCVEIIFDGGYFLHNSAVGDSFVRKILVFISGEYAANEETGSLTFFAGPEDYTGTPYMNSNGFKYLKDIYNILRSGE